jgi:hypothetical protein
VIVVIGSLRLRESEPDAAAAGLAASIAIAAAGEGARVEVIDKLGDDPAGDAVLLSLARQNVGHVAVLRDAGRQTPVSVDAADDMLEEPAATAPDLRSAVVGLDAGDAGLALRYLPEIAVIVAVHAPADVLVEAVAAAGWADTSLVVVLPEGVDPPAELPDTAVTLAALDTDESGVGAAIGRYAAAIDRGERAAAAYDALVAAGQV